MSDLSKIQAEHTIWKIKNFGEMWKDEHVKCAFLGVVEEVGELAHHLLKKQQKIRIATDAHIRDDIGDIVIFLMDLCTGLGWNLEEIVEETWDSVKQRDWTKKNEDA